ncbi:MAG TPA: hypothetical protein DCY35_07190 [Prolixibacteraceae bacterium]|nr:hypothetical protein [Prolixibacteraceae bacterium]
MNLINHEFSNFIIARAGIYHAKGKASIITIFVDVNTEGLNSLSDDWEISQELVSNQDWQKFNNLYHEYLYRKFHP